jgi:rare lipoprotein A
LQHPWGWPQERGDNGVATIDQIVRAVLLYSSGFNMQESAMPACEPRSRPASSLVAALACAMLFGCAQLERAPERAPEPAPTSPAPTTPAPALPSLRAPPSSGDTATSTQQRGRISMYGNDFAGKKTASGERFDPTALTMAHRTLPFGTRVRVTNLENQRSVEVVVNDRGPFVSGRIADLSEAAARRLGMVADGVVEALLDILRPGNAQGGRVD